ncbi:MAG: hypothetical protein IT370_15665 [Deltaproteobacteria bacterium]|nr:hypothetical protein [Deltaproteobacteria bacterium]
MRSDPQRGDPPNPYRQPAKPAQQAEEVAECDEPLLLVVALVVAVVCGLRVGFAVWAEDRFGPGASVAALVMFGAVWVVRDLIRSCHS